MPQDQHEPNKPMIVGAGGAKRPLESTSQRDLVSASLRLCPPREQRDQGGRSSS